AAGASAGTVRAPRCTSGLNANSRNPRQPEWPRTGAGQSSPTPYSAGVGALSADAGDVVAARHAVTAATIVQLTASGKRGSRLSVRPFIECRSPVVSADAGPPLRRHRRSLDGSARARLRVAPRPTAVAPAGVGYRFSG